MMPCLVEVFDMENHDDHPLTQSQYKQHGSRDERKPNERRAYSVMTAHPLYQNYDLNIDCKARRERR